MAYGMSPALATLILNHLRGNTAWTMPTSIYAKMHVGDPGVNGTANPSAVTTRQLITFALSGTTITVTGTSPTFAETATEVIAGLSFWDAPTGGTFLWSSAVTPPRSVINGDTPAILAEAFGFNTGIAA